MRTTGHYLLHLILGLAGLLAATLVAGWSAHHGGGLVFQGVIGAAAYLAVTGIAGRLTGTGAADATADSITALAAVVAWAIDTAGVLLIGAAALVTNSGTHPAQAVTPIEAAPADTDHYAKTA